MAEIFENTYGDRYESLLPKVISDIEREIARLSDPILNGTVADNQKLTYLLENETELKRYVNDRYGLAYSQSTNGAYADSIEFSKGVFESESIPFGFRQDQLDVMSQLKRRNVLLYNLETGKAADIIFDSMLSWAYSGSAESLAPFEAQVGAMGASRYGSTIINTQIDTFNRSVTAMAAEDAGVTRFRYVGPKPDREFCSHVLNGDRAALGVSGVEPSGEGRVYTIEEINSMDNGQTGDVLRTSGGWNCRHFWVPVQ